MGSYSFRILFQRILGSFRGRKQIEVSKEMHEKQGMNVPLFITLKQLRWEERELKRWKLEWNMIQ
jgi:AMMECR1 domain-containing protein